MSVSPRPFFVFVFSERKESRFKKVSQTHRQKYFLFSDLNNLGFFVKFRYLSHMRKVKLKNTCAAIFTIPNGVLYI